VFLDGGGGGSAKKLENTEMLNNEFIIAATQMNHNTRINHKKKPK